MKIRKYVSSDAEKVDEIYKRCHGHFALPDLNHCLNLAVVEDDKGEVIAFGAFELIPEVTLVLDTDKSKKAQVKALKELLLAGDFCAALNGFDSIYAFPDSTPYSEILKKHFNFQTGNPILVKKVDNGR